jgi:alkylation response protein AidB-like acyl-CoA dehydrogenase
MDFDFSDEQYAFRDSIRGFLARRSAPGGLGIPAPWGPREETLWMGLADLGVFSVLVPERYGGLGLTFVDLSLVLEEFGRVLLPPLVMETLAATDVIARFGSDGQKSTMLPLIAGGRLKLSCALSESGGYDPADMLTAVESTTAGERLQGAKILVPDAAAADILVVSARLGGRTALLLLERGREGVQLREQRTLDLLSAYDEPTLANVVIHTADILGGAASLDAVRRLCDASAVSAAAFMTGIAGKVMETSVDYVKQRKQFGQPIGSFQAIKHKCADMAVAIESSRSAAYYAAWSLASDAPDRAKAVSIAKSFCGDTSRQVCNEGIQLHGGMGFTWDLGLHHYLRRAKVLEYLYGDATYHRQRLLSAALLELSAPQRAAADDSTDRSGHRAVPGVALSARAE